MTIPLFTEPVPTTADPENFAARADTLVSELNPFVVAMNAAIAALNTISTTATSTTSNNVATLGSKTFTVTAGKSFFVGMSLTIANTAAPTNRMFAVVTSYSGTTLQVTSQAFEGTGTFTAWSISASFNGVISAGQIPDLLITNAKLAQDYISALTAVTLDPVNDYFAVSDGSDSGNKKKVLLPDATATAKGISELATDAEYVTGTDATRIITPSVARANNLVQGIAVNTTSGTSVDFTGIPSWAKRVTVEVSGVSTNGTAFVGLQIGDSGGIENAGYLGGYSLTTGGGVSSGNFTSMFISGWSTAANIRYGTYILSLISGNIWACTFQIGASDISGSSFGGGTKTLTATLDRVRITTSNGTDTFDSGSINIIYE